MRGPRIGDAASLWNFTPSPGWSKEEVYVLKLCLMKYGVGSWKDISMSGLLPGKAITQLNAQTQRLLGQQQLSGLSGLKVDVDRIRTDNESKEGVTRKGGLIVNFDKNPTAEFKKKLREENLAKYALTPEQVIELEEQLTEYSAMTRNSSALSIMRADLADLSRPQLQDMLALLQEKLKSLRERLEGARAGTVTLGMAAPEGARGGEAGAPRGGVTVVVQMVNKGGKGKERDKEAGGKKRKATGAASAVEAWEEEAGLGSKKRKAGPASKKGKALADRSNSPLVARLDEDDYDEEYEDEEVMMMMRDAALTQLLEMGFDRKKVLRALDLNQNNVESATMYLLQHC